MKRKLLSGILTAAMMTTLLTGCAGAQKNVPKDTSADAESAASGGSEKGIKLNITSWNEPNPDPELDMFTQCEKATGLDIDVSVIPEAEYSSKLNQMVSTGDDSADIYVVWENDIKNFAEVGGIVPMDDYLKDSNIESSDFIDAVEKLTDGLGGTYGLPWGAATEILYYNQDMFDAAGIAYPDNDWSYKDFMEAAEKLTQKNADGTTDVYGCTLPNTQTWWAGIGIAGDQIYDPSTGQLVIGTGAKAFLEDCTDMTQKGIMPEPSSDTTDLFASGKAAMQWAGSWNISSYADQLDFNWDITTIPTNKIKYNTLHTGFYTINAKSKNKDAAWKAIEYLMGEEGQVVTSKASGNPSAIKSIAAKGDWKVEAASTIDNWDAMTDSLKAGVFGYTCLPSGVTNHAVSLFNSAVLGEITADEAVSKAMQYAAETIGYSLD